MTHYLYRHFDKNDILLYVGISISALERNNYHRNNSFWFEKIKTIKITNFKTRKEAAVAEMAAIAKEHPVYNKIHSRREKINRETGEVNIKYNIKMRLEFIEKKLKSNGILNREDMKAVFSISLSQASIDFLSYKKIAPENMVYHQALHAYVIGPKFKPVFTK